ncbi:MAG: ECF transporter S component, partial [Clostridia bacterium]|nr:ECF transporter S component [Clostridia bacterium]
MAKSKNTALARLLYSSMFLALALLLPFLTAQIKPFGSALCPMHLPVILCGFICGPSWGMAVGAT